MIFESTDSYIATDELSMAVDAAAKLERPLLIKGEPGTGKTMLAIEVAKSLGMPLLEWHIKSTTKAVNGLYEYDAVSRLRDSQLGDERVNDISNYIKKGKMWEAFTANQQVVLLIDEIDKADHEFEAFLLEVLSEFQVSIPELGTIKAKQKPFVFLTSNNTRELSDALKRRCLHLYVPFPEAKLEQQILRARVPDLTDALMQQLVAFVQGVRELDLKKHPSVSETLDWARALMLLNASELDGDLVRQTLNVILKFEEDITVVDRQALELVRMSEKAVRRLSLIHI